MGEWRKRTWWPDEAGRRVGAQLFDGGLDKVRLGRSVSVLRIRSRATTNGWDPSGGVRLSRVVDRQGGGEGNNDAEEGP